jgi:uncharacterized protein with gpF-like domain
MTASAEHIALPFDEAIAFFRQKLNVPTQRWTDLWQAGHDRGFMVAGAAEDALLTDLRGLVDTAISKGTDIREFRSGFADAVNRAGWSYKGSFGWRTSVILDTNLSTAYAAGHYAQAMDPDVLADRPYFRYLASSSREKRPEHMQWCNLVLAADHPWWNVHYPPNGWG